MLCALEKKKIAKEERYFIFDIKNESAIHAIWLCGKAKLLWKESKFWSLLSGSNFSTFVIFIRWCLMFLKLDELSLVTYISWLMWYQHNIFLHGRGLKLARIVFQQADPL